MDANVFSLFVLKTGRRKTTVELIRIVKYIIKYTYNKVVIPNFMYPYVCSYNIST